MPDQESFLETMLSLAETNQFLTSDAISKAVEFDEGITYLKRDFLFRSGHWRGTPQEAGAKIKPSGTLILGHSDLSTTQLTALGILARLPAVSNVWATNLTFRSQKFSSIPLGLTNFCDDSPAHPILGDQRTIASAINNSSARKNRIYANHSAATSSKYRGNLEHVLRYSKRVTRGKYDLSHRGREKYLIDMIEHGFVLCPRGNGLDTHRLFETLCVGAVPILLRSEVPIWLRLLPTKSFLEIDNWLEIDNLDLDVELEYLEPVEAEILTSHFWINKVRDSARFVKDEA